MMLNLEKPAFTQDQVLRMLPLLKAKQLQNWSARGLLDEGDQKPGKGGRRRYTAIGVLMLDFMQRVTDLGVPPAPAKEMANDYAHAATEYVQSGPEVIVKENGGRWIPIRPEDMKRFRMGQITKVDEGHYYMIVRYPNDPDAEKDRFISPVRLTVEVDYSVAMAINQMFLLENDEI